MIDQSGNEEHRGHSSPVPRRAPSRRRFWLGGLCGAVLGGMIGLQITYVPSNGAWGYDVTWLIGTALLALLGAALGFTAGLISIVMERLSRRER